MGDGQRRGFRLESSERAQRHALARGRFHVNFAEIIRSELEAWVGFQNDTILTQLREDGRDLPLSEGIVESVVNGLREDIQPGGFLAIHQHVGLQPAGLLIAGQIREFGRVAQFIQELASPK